MTTWSLLQANPEKRRRKPKLAKHFNVSIAVQMVYLLRLRRTILNRQTVSSKDSDQVHLNVQEQWGGRTKLGRFTLSLLSMSTEHRILPVASNQSKYLPFVYERPNEVIARNWLLAVLQSTSLRNFNSVSLAAPRSPRHPTADHQRSRNTHPHEEQRTKIATSKSFKTFYRSLSNHASVKTQVRSENTMASAKTIIRWGKFGPQKAEASRMHQK